MSIERRGGWSAGPSRTHVCVPCVHHSSDGNDASASNGDDQIAGNPIGWLQEQCMVRRWPPPTYETEMEVGLPHQRQFTIACCVLKLREIGQGKSKKIAKRLAAHKMFTLLAQNPDEQGGMGELGNAGMDEVSGRGWMCSICVRGGSTGRISDVFIFVADDIDLVQYRLWCWLCLVCDVLGLCLL